MSGLSEQLFCPDGVLFYPFWIGLAGSLSFGMIGSYTVVRRISYAAHSISHTVLLGIGATLFSGHASGGSVSMQAGAFAAALLAAWVIGIATLYAPHRADPVISAVLVLGLSGGLLFLSRVPGYFDPMSVLFGDILMVGKSDVWRTLGVNALTVSIGGLFYLRFQAVCFDEEFARLRGMHAGFWYLLLLSLIALTVVAMMQIVGLILVTALLTLPVMTVLNWTRTLLQTMVWSSLLCAVCVSGGLILSYLFDLPSGPVITVFCGTVYLLACALRALRCKSSIDKP